MSGRYAAAGKRENAGSAVRLSNAQGSREGRSTGRAKGMEMTSPFCAPFCAPVNRASRRLGGAALLALGLYAAVALKAADPRRGRRSRSPWRSCAGHGPSGHFPRRSSPLMLRRSQSSPLIAMIRLVSGNCPDPGRTSFVSIRRGRDGLILYARFALALVGGVRGLRLIEA